MGMDKDIEHLVHRCNKSEQAAKHPAREEPVAWPQTEAKPWFQLHLDFAGPINGMAYLVVVDGHSKWPEVIPLKSATSGMTVGARDRIISTHGIPETLVSHNGTQFPTYEFSQFCSQWSIEHIGIPPYHTQSNEQAERFVDMLKRVLHKAKEEGPRVEALQLFLLAYRTTPHAALRAWGANLSWERKNGCDSTTS